MARVTAIIPARLGSKRFPRKVLHDFRGRPLLYYVWAEVAKSNRINTVAIATDDREIEKVARSFGANVIRTAKSHPTGSDRVAEAARQLGGDIILNVQADNFGLKASGLSSAINRFERLAPTGFGTLVTPVTTDEELFDPNVVKVVASGEGEGLWFSRFPLPYLQHATGGKRVAQFGFMKHIGIYFFRRKALEKFANWRRGPMERSESLEQLRILEHGERIHLMKTNMTTVSVDTPDDLKKINRIYR